MFSFVRCFFFLYLILKVTVKNFSVISGGVLLGSTSTKPVTGKGMRHSPIKNGNVTSFFAMDAPRSLSDFYDHFRYEIGEYK